MMEKELKQQSFDIWSIPFSNDSSLNCKLEETSKCLVALQPESPLHSVVYPISEANSSTPFNLMICFNKDRLWKMNVMNYGEIKFMM